MITSIEPRVSLSGRYPAGEAAQLLGIHRNTLKKYTDAGASFTPAAKSSAFGRHICKPQNTTNLTMKKITETQQAKPKTIKR